MNPTIFIMGKSGVGKDFLVKKVLTYPNTHNIIQYTTRPIREGEVDGRDINCVSRETIKKMISNKDLFEIRHYDVLVNNEPDIWFYGTPALDKQPEGINILAAPVALTKIALQTYYNYRDKMAVIMLDAPDELRTKRAEKRGSFDSSEWNRRLKTDANDFSDEKIEELEIILGKPVIRFNNILEDNGEAFMSLFTEIANKLTSK